MEGPGMSAHPLGTVVLHCLEPALTILKSTPECSRAYPPRTSCPPLLGLPQKATQSKPNPRVHQLFKYLKADPTPFTEPDTCPLPIPLLRRQTIQGFASHPSKSCFPQVRDEPRRDFLHLTLKLFILKTQIMKCSRSHFMISRILNYL